MNKSFTLPPSLPPSLPASNRDVVTPKANPKLSKGTKRGMMGHIAVVAIAKPKEMRMKPASQLWREGGRKEGREGGREG